MVESLLNDALNPNAHRTSFLDEVQHEQFDADLAQSDVIGPDSRDSPATALAFIENFGALTVVSAPEHALAP